LHFGPTPQHALAYFQEATKFLAVGVEIATLRPITGSTAKAKAPRVVRACVEVDINGKAHLAQLKFRCIWLECHKRINSGNIGTQP
jgi:hypothetical protein